MNLKTKLISTLILILGVSGCGGPSYYEETINAARVNNIPLIIWSATPSSPNSAGGVDLDIKFTNTSFETIKYINYTVRAYNSVGDPAGGEIRSSSYRNLNDTGPHRAGDTDESHWGTLYYNWSIECVQVTKASIEFMNGKKKTYSGKSLEKLFGPTYVKSCKVD